MRWGGEVTPKEKWRIFLDNKAHVRKREVPREVGKGKTDSPNSLAKVQ